MWQRKRGDLAAMLLRGHIEPSQVEVRKLKLNQLHVTRQGTARRNGERP